MAGITKRKKIVAARDVVIVLLDEINQRADVPLDIRIRAQDALFLMRGTMQHGRTSLIPSKTADLLLFMDSQISADCLVGEAAARAAKQFKLSRRRIEQIYRAFDRVLSEDTPAK